MKRFTYIFLVLLLVPILSCEKEPVKTKNQVIGYWINPVYNDSTVTLDKASSFEENEYGFAFLENKLFIERKNSGWCATPPISFEDYKGTWSKSENTIQITVEYWGGITDYEWEIISVHDTQLIVKKLN